MDTTARRLLDNIAHPVFALEADKDGVPRYCAFNRVARDLLGRSEAEILGLTAAELYPGRLGRIAFDHHVEVLTTRAETTYELSLPLKDGQRRIRTTLKPVVDENGDFASLMGTSVDVTEGQALREMRAGAETLAREIGEFASSAALDVRRPMLRVRAIADRLREGFQDLGDGKLELIDVLEKVSSDSLALITDVLSQIEATSATGEVVDFDFGEMAEEVMALLDPLRHCACEITHGYVRGDRTAIRITLRSLVEASLKRARADASGGGASPVRLNIAVADSRDGCFSLSVADNCQHMEMSSLSLLNRGALHADNDPALLAIRRMVVSRGGRLKALNLPDDGGVRIELTMPGRLRTKTLSVGPAHIPSVTARAAASEAVVS